MECIRPKFYTFYRLLQQSGLKIFTTCHVHSSAKGAPENLRDYLPPSNCTSRMNADVRITIIWKENGKNIVLQGMPKSRLQ